MAAGPLCPPVVSVPPAAGVVPASGVAADPAPSAGLWQPVQVSTANAVWFSGNGFILPMPWQVVQSLYWSPSIGCGMAAGPLCPPDSPLVAAPGSGVGPGRWHTTQDSLGRPAWSAG